MHLQPGSYIAMEISADGTEIKIRRVTMPKFSDPVAEAESVEGPGPVENADANTVPLTSSL
jgi:hypothetical protein